MKKIVTGASLAAMPFALCSFATAATPPVDAPDSSIVRAQTTTHTEVNNLCMSQLKISNASLAKDKQLPSSLCTRTVTLQITEEDPQNAPAEESPSADEADSASDSSSRGLPIHTRYFKQTVAQGTDQETQSGHISYNGSRVWISGGQHHCWVNYEVGYKIEIPECNGGSSGSTTQAHMKLKVNMLAGWFPIGWNEDYYVIGDAHGGLKYKN